MFISLGLTLDKRAKKKGKVTSPLLDQANTR
jgi:hypothetical protein